MTTEIKEEEMKVWTELCDEHARLLIDKEDYDSVRRLEKNDDDWPCLVEGCDERATVLGLVRAEPSPKNKQEASA